METEKHKIDSEKLQRRKPRIVVDEEEKPQSVSAGAVDKALDLAFNPSREKIREVTIIDRVQGRMFPLLDVINTGRQYVMEIALYRQNKDLYKVTYGQSQPIPPNLLDELLYRTAQWQKSVQGANLTKITDIALAETESRIDEEDQYGSKDAFKDDE